MSLLITHYRMESKHNKNVASIIAVELDVEKFVLANIQGNGYLKLGNEMEFAAGLRTYRRPCTSLAQLLCSGYYRTAVHQNESSGFSTHSHQCSCWTWFLNKKPNSSPKHGGHLKCSACRGPFVFYNRLRQVALNQLDEDPTRLYEIADVLLTIHQCDTHSLYDAQFLSARTISRREN